MGEFRMPAEWAPHAATWLAWPHKEASWPGRLDRIPPIFAAAARELARGEAVHINVGSDAMAAEAREHLRAAGAALEHIHLHAIPTNDAWIRDHGPMFVARECATKPALSPAPGAARAGTPVILDWGYNAWGGKYPPYDLDDAVPRRVGEVLGIEVLEPGMILEGGSIDVDGEGTLLTTEACLLHPSRNPSLGRAAIEANLRRWVGAERVLWLGEGIAGDDTDGHVDDLTRFTAPGVVVTAVEERRSDENYEPLRVNLERLRGMRDARGRGLEIHALPMPDPVEVEGQRLPASYANFYISNRVVLMPAFACPQDRAARAVLTRLFPGREVVSMNCRDLVWGLGAFHCLTMQQPVI